MGKWLGGPDSNAAEWWNRPPARIAAGLAGLVLLIAVLSGCGSSGAAVDEGAWRADVEAVEGHAVVDWPTFRDTYVDDVCTGDLGYFVALSMDDGSLDRTMVSIRHACPERLPDVVDAVATVGGF